jgi:imidazolonepropionase-like amidohydrolase
MKLIKYSLVAMAFTSLASFVEAKSLAITNATVYTASEQGILNNATVVVENGTITAINPDSINTDEVYDAQGKILTPGFIGAMNQLGLVEVNAVSATRDAGDKKADITFDASLAFNPLSSVIPYSRKGGITRDIVIPRGGESIFKGQSFVADLSGNFNSVLIANNAVFATIGAKNKGSRALSIQTLFNSFADIEEKLAKANTTKKEDKKAAKKLKRNEEVLAALLKGEKPLVVAADRASDLLALLKLKKRFNLNLIIAGAADAELISADIVAADVPLLIDAMRDLPGSFDSLHVSLTTAANLINAGVKVGFIQQDAHNLYQLRFDAGNAVANGVGKEQALAAISANIADMFNLNVGRIAQGQVADLVLWNADPFEISSKVEKLWINGKSYSLKSRQDALRKRYMTQSVLPTGYIK